MKYFSSDWHIGHTNIIKYANRPFYDVDTMNSIILKNMFKHLNAGDILYFLGDLAFGDENITKTLSFIPKFIDFHWILGNHDLKNYAKFKHLVKSISFFKEIKIGKHYVTLCHYPMLTWNKSHYNSWMLHGHHHIGENMIDDLKVKTNGKILNVNCEFNNYRPWSEKDVEIYINNQPDNWNYLGK